MYLDGKNGNNLVECRNIQGYLSIVFRRLILNGLVKNMTVDNGKVKTEEEKRRKMNKMIKKEAEKNLKPKMGEIREFEVKSKKKKKN